MISENQEKIKHEKDPTLAGFYLNLLSSFRSLKAKSKEGGENDEGWNFT